MPFGYSITITKSDSSSSSGENSTHPNTTSVFDHLQSLSDAADFKDALKVMQNAPDEYKNAFITIYQTIDRQSQAPVSVSQPPPAAVMKPVKAFLLITGQTHGADQQILGQLNALGSRVTHTNDPQHPSDVVLLLCPVLSRVRSDVESAFRKIPDGAKGKPVILVLLHHTRKVEQVLKESRWMEEFPDIILEVQALYHETMGGLLQNCPRNQEALMKLGEVLQKRSKTESMDITVNPVEPKP